MSRIIKGGDIKFFSLDLSRVSSSEEEYFSPLQALLPEELLEAREAEVLPNPEEASAAAHESSSFQEDPPQEDPVAPEGPVSLEGPSGPQESPNGEVDPLSLPGVAERLAHLEQEAYEKGFAQGQKDGMELGRQQYESMAARLKELVKSLEGEIERHVLALEGPIFSLVKTMAEKVIQKEISMGPEVLKGCIREALTHVVEQSRVRLHLNPEDIDYMEEVLQELSVEFSRIKDFELIPDDNIARGGCLLETDFGLVDATYERKWREILRRLEE